MKNCSLCRVSRMILVYPSLRLKKKHGSPYFLVPVFPVVEQLETQERASWQRRMGLVGDKLTCFFKVFFSFSHAIFPDFMRLFQPKRRKKRQKVRTFSALLANFVQYLHHKGRCTGRCGKFAQCLMWGVNILQCCKSSRSMYSRTVMKKSAIFSDFMRFLAEKVGEKRKKRKSEIIFLRFWPILYDIFIIRLDIL